MITDNTPKIWHNITKWRIKQTDWFGFGLIINEQLREFTLSDNIEEYVEHTDISCRDVHVLIQLFQ